LLNPLCGKAANPVDIKTIISTIILSDNRDITFRLVRPGRDAVELEIVSVRGTAHHTRLRLLYAVWNALALAVFAGW
jgi:hypothetical protein